MNKVTLLEERKEWASYGALAARFGLKESTVRSWVKKIREDPRLSLDERLSLVVGSRTSTRVNVWGLFLYLEGRRASSSQACRIH